MYHLIAEISDRRDVLGIWRSLLSVTSGVMPCAQCRAHFAAYLREHSMTFIRSKLLPTGVQVRDKIRNELWIFHNLVNKRLGLKEYEKETLSSLYASKSRGEILLEAQKLAEEIKAVWAPLVHSQVNGIAFREWKRTIVKLFALLQSGPN